MSPDEQLSRLFEDIIHAAPTWISDALCAQVDSGMFFPPKGDSSQDAKAVCAHCPVRTQCLDYAVEHRIRDGIWGGTAYHERRAIWQREGAA